MVGMGAVTDIAKSDENFENELADGDEAKHMVF